MLTRERGGALDALSLDRVLKWRIDRNPVILPCFATKSPTSAPPAFRHLRTDSWDSRQLGVFISSPSPLKREKVLLGGEQISLVKTRKFVPNSWRHEIFILLARAKWWRCVCVCVRWRRHTGCPRAAARGFQCSIAHYPFGTDCLCVKAAHVPLVAMPLKKRPAFVPVWRAMWECETKKITFIIGAMTYSYPAIAHNFHLEPNNWLFRI